MDTFPLKCGIVCMVMLMYQCTCICNSATHHNGRKFHKSAGAAYRSLFKDSNVDRNTQRLGLPIHHKKDKRNTALCVGCSYRKFYH